MHKEESRADRLDLVGGELALDFINTASGRGTPEAVEHLRAPADLARWAAHAGLPLAPDAALPDDAFRAARDLRDTLFRTLDPLARGGTPDAVDVAAVSAALAAVLADGRLDITPGAARGWTFAGACDPATPILGPVLLSAEEILTRRDHTRLRACPGAGCGWLFYDRSKNNTRRWCDMAVCGNRGKAARFRGRGADKTTAIPRRGPPDDI